MITITNKEEFNAAIASGKCIIKIGSEFCGPCRLLEQNLKAVEQQLTDVKFYSIDAEDCDGKIMDELSIRNIPVLIVYEDGVQKERKNGLATVEEIKNFF